jgi:hypothetical protein
MKEEIGNKYGWLVVIKRNGTSTKRFKRALWLCRCKCGKMAIVDGTTLRTGGKKSCGCMPTAIKILPKQEASFNKFLRGMQSSAKKRKHAWNLSKEQVHYLTQQPCVYCGQIPRQGSFNSISNGVFVHNGIDRIDSNRDYNIDNVVSACKVCNYAKHTKTTEQFKEWVSKVYKYFVVENKTVIDGMVV